MAQEGAADLQTGIDESNINTAHYYLVLVIVWVRYIANWRASEASETLSGVYKFELMQYVYIYIYMYTRNVLCKHKWRASWPSTNISVYRLSFLLQ